jgi:hypothetical protein
MLKIILILLLTFYEINCLVKHGEDVMIEGNRQFSTNTDEIKTIVYDDNSFDVFIQCKCLNNDECQYIDYSICVYSFDEIGNQKMNINELLIPFDDFNQEMFIGNPPAYYSKTSQVIQIHDITLHKESINVYFSQYIYYRHPRGLHYTNTLLVSTSFNLNKENITEYIILDSQQRSWPWGATHERKHKKQKHIMHNDYQAIIFDMYTANSGDDPGRYYIESLLIEYNNNSSITKTIDIRNGGCQYTGGISGGSSYFGYIFEMNYLNNNGDIIIITDCSFPNGGVNTKTIIIKDNNMHNYITRDSPPNKRTKNIQLITNPNEYDFGFILLLIYQSTYRSEPFPKSGWIYYNNIWGIRHYNTNRQLLYTSETDFGILLLKPYYPIWKKHAELDIMKKNDNYYMITTDDANPNDYTSTTTINTEYSYFNYTVLGKKMPYDLYGNAYKMYNNNPNNIIYINVKFIDSYLYFGRYSLYDVIDNDIINQIYTPGIFTAAPTSHPTSIPSSAPTSMPSSSMPSSIPSTSYPTSIPTCIPTNVPSVVPSTIPTSIPSTSIPSSIPTLRPTPIPTSIPTSPTLYPTSIPSSILLKKEDDNILSLSLSNDNVVLLIAIALIIILAFTCLWKCKGSGCSLNACNNTTNTTNNINDTKHNDDTKYNDDNDYVNNNTAAIAPAAIALPYPYPAPLPSKIIAPSAPPSKLAPPPSFAPPSEPAPLPSAPPSAPSELAPTPSELAPTPSELAPAPSAPPSSVPATLPALNDRFNDQYSSGFRSIYYKSEYVWNNIWPFTQYRRYVERKEEKERKRIKELDKEFAGIRRRLKYDECKKKYEENPHLWEQPCFFVPKLIRKDPTNNKKQIKT